MSRNVAEVGEYVMDTGYLKTQIQALIVTQMLWSDWVEDGKVGGTKSPILFVAYDLQGINLKWCDIKKGINYTNYIYEAPMNL